MYVHTYVYNHAILIFQVMDQFSQPLTPFPGKWSTTHYGCERTSLSPLAKSRRMFAICMQMHSSSLTLHNSPCYGAGFRTILLAEHKYPAGFVTFITISNLDPDLNSALKTSASFNLNMKIIRQLPGQSNVLHLILYITI